MRTIIILITVMFGAHDCIADEYGSVTAIVKRVIDGDTIKVDIPGYPPIVGKNVSVRLYGVNTCELRSKSKVEARKAYEAKRYLASLLPVGTKVTLKRIERGKYFRIVAHVITEDGTNINIKIGTLIDLGVF